MVSHRGEPPSNNPQLSIIGRGTVSHFGAQPDNNRSWRILGHGMVSHLGMPPPNNQHLCTFGRGMASHLAAQASSNLTLRIVGRGMVSHVGKPPSNNQAVVYAWPPNGVEPWGTASVDDQPLCIAGRGMVSRIGVARVLATLLFCLSLYVSAAANSDLSCSDMRRVVGAAHSFACRPGRHGCQTQCGTH